MNTTTLSTLVSPRKETIHLAKIEDEYINYIGMANVNKGTQRLSPVNIIPKSAVKSAVSAFKKHDILYGSLRPELRKVVVAGEDGYCSTEFLVLTPEDYRNSLILVDILKSDQFYEQIKKHIRGSRPRIASHYVLSADVPSLKTFDSLRNEIERVHESLASINQIITEANIKKIELSRQINNIVESALSS